MPLAPKLLKEIVKHMIQLYMKFVKELSYEVSLESIWPLDADINKNYRPVNNLVFFSKLTERVVVRRTNEHMAENALHNKNQFAYKQYHNKERIMIGVVERSDEEL